MSASIYFYFDCMIYLIIQWPGEALITSSNTGCAMTLKSDQFSPHNSARKQNVSRRVRKPQQIVTSSLTFVQSGYISISASPTGVCKHNPHSENRNTCGSVFFVCSSLRIVNYALARPQSSRRATLWGPRWGLWDAGRGQIMEVSKHQ